MARKKISRKAPSKHIEAPRPREMRAAEGPLQACRGGIVHREGGLDPPPAAAGPRDPVHLTGTGSGDYVLRAGGEIVLRPGGGRQGGPLPTRMVPLHRFGNRVTRALGWQPSLPDMRDCTPGRIAKSAKVKIAEAKDAFGKFVHRVFNKQGAAGKGVINWKTLAEWLRGTPQVDLADNCSPIEDQGNLGSCTANSCVGMVEYLERTASGTHIDASRLFLYKVTRKLLNWYGDTGAYLRSTMKALVLFGVPPEDVWPYEPETFDQEPDAFMYAYGANYRAIQYMRLDPPGMTGQEVLTALKTVLAAKFVAVLGFPVYDSLTNDPDIPYPKETDNLVGGHAVLAVGYDDNKQAVKIRNSWGADWGDEGYGWLPYEYFTQGLAADLWTCFKLSWVNSAAFGGPEGEQ